ncbi:MAG TPA: M48 family metallopeptidase [Clostridia bacterium]|nr:M48 family metallopeptidase [Clostridia bacterium]
MLDLKFMRSVALGLVLTLGIAPSCSASSQHVRQDASGRLQPDTSNISVSPEEEIKLGRQAMAEVEKQLPILPDSSPVSQYVSRLGQRLAANAPGYKWPYVFKVVNQKDINAFAMPGGPVYVNVGTIQAADESELAGVMAHEISHVVMRHSMRQASKSQWIQIGGALGSAVLGGLLGNGMGGQLAQLGIQLGAGGVIMKYSREAETEADLIGSQIMYDAGFNPYAMVEFFQVLAKQGGGGGPQFLSDHPNPGNRAQTVANVIKKFPKKDFPRNDSAEFASMKRVADGLKPMTGQQIAAQQKQQRGGSIPGGGEAQVMPAGGFKDFDQGTFTISYPSNWEVFGDQQSGVTIAPRAGVAENAIAYGVVISGARPQDRTSLDDATKQIVQTMQQQNPDMKAAGNPQSIRVNGVKGRSVDMVSTSPLQSQNGASVRERDWLVTLPRSDGSVLFMVFVAPEPQFDQLRPTYEQMLRTVRVK